MRTSTRLLLPLTLTLTAALVVAALWLLGAREDALLSESRRETQAYATALNIALENASASDFREVHGILERVSREPKIYGMIVYGSSGLAVDASAPVRIRDAIDAEAIKHIAVQRLTITQQRQIGDAAFLSVLQPLRLGGESGGALEVLAPLSTVKAEIARTRARYLRVGVGLILAMALALRWFVQHTIGSPLRTAVEGTRAVGRGDLGYRIGAIKSGSELQQLAAEFDKMAASLETARQRAEREAEDRIALERRLQQTEKLAAVGNLAATLAHEIAAPLNVVAGRAEMLQDASLLPEKRDRNIAIIRSQIGRITAIVRNLLDYARRREPHMHTTDLRAVIESVLEFLDNDLRRADVVVETALTDDLMVSGDADLLHQVFLNLMLNAMQALEPKDDDRRVSISGAVAEDGSRHVVIIEVADNGPGIPPEIGQDVFEPFVTTKAGRSGTGLGLSVARAIVQEHGGSIDAVSGAGGHFTIVLPASRIFVHA